MLTGIHFLLTYACNLKCDHCFLHCGPQAQGTFTLKQVRSALDEVSRIGTVSRVCFEGGEPFLFYPIMLEGAKTAREMGFETGVLTNAYWATSLDDAERWLAPLAELGVSLTVSEDSFHYGTAAESPAGRASAAAERLRMRAGSIRIEKPTVESPVDGAPDKGAPIIGGGVRFRGRAVDTLTEGLPRRPWEHLSTCPHEDLRDPGRVHIDAFGHVHLCQGLSMGNMWQTPLSELVEGYAPDAHPVCGPLLGGGPARLAREYDVAVDGEYVDECQMCYLVRLALIDRFPQYLAPRQVYGLE